MHLEVHWLFALILALAAFAGFHLEALILLGSLALHELAHLVVAWVLGLGTSELILTPFGGMARMDSALEADPQAETSVALAGPFQSFFLAGLALFLSGEALWDQRLLHFCFEVNANLAFFNLIPALPLDGGRALRGLLAQRWGYRRVSRWMALGGRLSGAMMVGAALLVFFRERGVFMVTPFVGGLFLCLGAGQEVEVATYRTYRHFLHKREQMVRRRILTAQQLVAVANTKLRTVLEQLASRQYHLILVVDEEMRPLGTLHEVELMDAFTLLGPEATLEEVLDL